MNILLQILKEADTLPAILCGFICAFLFIEWIINGKDEKEVITGR